MTALRLLSAALLAGALAACSGSSIEAPADKGVCWTMTADKAGKIKFHKVAGNVPNLETCAANLEALRLRFLGMGGSRNELDGAYQGQFIFVQKEGIFSSAALNKSPYLALVRTGDGRLVAPGAASVQTPPP